MNNRNFGIFIFLIALMAVLVGWKVISAQPEESLVGQGYAATVYKSPTCGCCGLYTSYLDKKGFQVDVRDTTAMDEIKGKYGIPQNMQSCHTTVIGDYFVEGHVPVEVMARLLSEKPQIAGISLPAMPAGSPGMPGRKDQSWQIYQKSLDGEWSAYQTF